MLAALLLVTGLCWFSFPSMAAELERVQAKQTKQFQCRWADGPIRIDGQASDAAWQKAQLIEGFYLPWLKDQAPLARAATRARLLWDRDNLYFFADLEDQDLFADIRQHDGKTWNNDVFELFFKPAANRPGYYEFHVSAAGTMMDMFVPRREKGFFERHVKEIAFHLQSKVSLRGTLNQRQDKDQGWSVEGKIPWTDMLSTGGRPAVDEQWQFSLCRYDYSLNEKEPELSTTAPLSQRDFHRHEDYSPLQFVGPVSETAVQPYGVDRFVPATTSRISGSPDPPLPYRVERAYPDLKLDLPIFAILQPGTSQFIILDQDPKSGKARLVRTGKAQNNESLEVLRELASVAYSITFHPEFLSNGYMYLGDNAAVDGGPKKSRVVRYTMQRETPFKIVPDSEKIIIQWDSNGHNGAAVVFGHDGMMYITSGDGTSDSDDNITGQGLDHLLAKVLRIDVDHPDAGREYGVPKDNPLVGKKGLRPETWCVGMRNPWRMTVDARTGHIWVGNNGQDLWEQAYLIKRAANYGWSVYEGGQPFYLQRQLAPAPMQLTKPTVEHHHTEARSLTGGVVYYGKQYPKLQGSYIYGDYSTGKIWAVRHDGEKIQYHQEIADSTLAISAFAADVDGELLILDHRGGDAGGFYRLQPSVRQEQARPFPRKLSETGLFKSVPGHVVQPSLIPYSVNASLWSDGAVKQRYLALPKADSKIDFTQSRAWGLPDQTVLVKSFALEMKEGQAASRKWIETRLLTRQDGEWVGYSYAWNDQQTEAELVEKTGRDRVYQVQSATGPREQTWHYPSRSECMVCHSRAAGYLLGMSMMQMNKRHDYGGVVDHQFRTLEHLGLLRTSWHGQAVNKLRQQLTADGMPADQVKAHMDKVTKASGQRTAPATSLLFQDPSGYRKLVDPYDPGEPLVERARSYLHANCAQCHVNAGGGNSQIDLEHNGDLSHLKAINVTSLHDKFGLAMPHIITPGDPEASTLFLRVNRRGKGQMPQLSTNVVDQRAVEMLRSWIKQMPKAEKKSSGKKSNSKE
ncbi:MAG: PQQ-dependent sugar dehydrogenase [Pirellulaceae bacterium]